MHQRAIAITFLAFAVLTFAVGSARANVDAPRPVHDWTIHTTESAWGLASDGSRTVAFAGSRHLVIPLPFYAVAIPLLALLGLPVIAGVWRLSHRRAGR
jgi:hypothetical protein